MNRAVITILLLFASPIWIHWGLPAAGVAAQSKAASSDKSKKGPPPAPVQVAAVEKGVSAPVAEFIGTVYYSRISRVATEVQGIVTATLFEEGDRVDAGKNLLVLGSDLLETEIASQKAAHEQILVELEKATVDLTRMEALYRENSISQVMLDDHRYRRMELVKKASGLKAAYDRQLLIKQKKQIPAPFSGIVIEKKVEKGEWVAPGGTVAVIAVNQIVDVVVDVPEKVLSFLKPRMEVNVSFNGSRARAQFIRVIPKGDIATRTFAIKLRLANRFSLIEGMEARALLPVGPKRESLMVPRDAVIKKRGRQVVFQMADGKAKMVPVTVTGYEGSNVGIEAKGLTTGAAVVIKGNERIRNGQPLKVIAQ